MRKMLLITLVLILTGCLGMPEKVQPVTGFELNRYLGRWYEIARLDHSFIDLGKFCAGRIPVTEAKMSLH